eukprot:4877494-Alexandrium_andersonii.AAC.1
MTWRSAARRPLPPGGPGRRQRRNGKPWRSHRSQCRTKCKQRTTLGAERPEGAHGGGWAGRPRPAHPRPPAPQWTRCSQPREEPSERPGTR